MRDKQYQISGKERKRRTNIQNKNKNKKKTKTIKHIYYETSG
jgi:hypothetical protein